MRFIIGNMDGKALNLNANELCVLEAIGKCSRGDSAKGWYGSMQALADILPFIVDRMTVDRAIKKLLEKGLIVRNEENSLFIAQIVQSDAQNVQAVAQNVQPNAQIVQNPTPLNNPPIDNNNQNKLTENTPCVPATEKADLFFMEYSFDIFLQAFHPTWPMSAARKAELRDKWENVYSPAKKNYIMQDLFAHEASNTLTDLRDPLTYCEKFVVPAPHNYRGECIPQGTQVFSAAYNGVFGMYTQDDIDHYRLTLPKE